MIEGMVKLDNEIGQQGGITVNPDRWFKRGAPSEFVVNPLEPNFDLKFPNNIPIYDEMRTTEGQIGSLLNAATLPIMSAKWVLDDAGCKPAVVEFVRQNIGLPKLGEPLTRERRRGIVWRDHLESALLCLPFGFMPFEQVYEIVPAPENLAQQFELANVAHLRKLAPRLPMTVKQIHVGRDGGLVGITQEPLLVTGWDDPIFIPVDRLVMYSLKREGADWSGKSILRQAYKHYLINDRLVRLGAQIVERNGMGVPVVKYDPETMTREDAEQIGAEFRAGARSSAAVPHGNDVVLTGVTGTTVDPLPQIKYHDEKIAGSALAMFLTLGHDAGARSLGDTFLDIFTQSLQSVADFIGTTFTEHVIRDLVEMNFGADEPYPSLTPGLLAENREITTTALKELVDAGVVTPDDKLEAHIRKQQGLPEADADTARKPAAAPASAAAPVDGATPAVAVPAATQLSAGSHDDELREMLQRIIELRTGGAGV
ncbi:portal protein [Arthrobacter phage EastWest]|uniref:Portal protein n=1 Tax=Arthrobacter phage EastWest TaxID=2894292 RepID=A0AAE8YP18_9CAUD|nr:portal protein [Arthrobacter phage EastWest]